MCWNLNTNRDGIMILSKRTIEILRCCSSINPSIVFKKGSTIKTISLKKDILFEGYIDEKFSMDFGIVDLKKFITFYNKMNNPNIEMVGYEDNVNEGIAEKLVFRNGMKEVTNPYYTCELNEIVQPPEKEITFPKTLGSLFLSKDKIKSIKSLMNSFPRYVYLLPSKNPIEKPYWVRTLARKLSYFEDLVIYGCRDSNSIYGQPSVQNNVFPNDKIIVEDNLENDNWFLEKPDRKLIFNNNSYKLIPADYEVEFGDGIAKFETTDGDLKYWIALLPCSVMQ
jgi:hypothetical protein